MFSINKIYHHYWVNIIKSLSICVVQYMCRLQKHTEVSVVFIIHFRDYTCISQRLMVHKWGSAGVIGTIHPSPPPWPPHPSPFCTPNSTEGCCTPDLYHMLKAQDHFGYNNFRLTTIGPLPPQPTYSNTLGIQNWQD